MSSPSSSPSPSPLPEAEAEDAGPAEAGDALAAEMDAIARQIEPELPMELMLFHPHRLQFELVGTCDKTRCADMSCEVCQTPARHCRNFMQQHFQAVMMRRPVMFARFFPDLPEILSYIIVFAGYACVQQRISAICNVDEMDLYSFAPNWREWMERMHPARELAGKLIYHMEAEQQARLAHTTTRAQMLFEMERIIEYRMSIMAATSLAFKVCKYDKDFECPEVVEAIYHAAEQRVEFLRQDAVIEVRPTDALYRIIPSQVIANHDRYNEEHERDRAKILADYEEEQRQIKLQREELDKKRAEEDFLAIAAAREAARVAAIPAPDPSKKVPAAPDTEDEEGLAQIAEGMVGLQVYRDHAGGEPAGAVTGMSQGEAGGLVAEITMASEALDAIKDIVGDGEGDGEPFAREALGVGLTPEGEEEKTSAGDE